MADRLSTRRVERNESSYEGFSDARNSFVPVWISMPPFLMLEYFIELSVPSIPPALVFPVGFLLFWAFYFTYYKPNVLEDRLTDPVRRNISFPPSLILGFAIWFVRASLLEVRYLVWESFRKNARIEQQPVSDQFRKIMQGPESFREPLRREGTHAYANPDSNAAKAAKSAPQPEPQPVARPRYPQDVQRALMVLGFEKGAAVNWTEVHKRYRFLAKKLHPDLNDTGTQGRRFIEVDQAYRALSRRKDLF